MSDRTFLTHCMSLYGGGIPLTERDLARLVALAGTDRGTVRELVLLAIGRVGE